MNSTHNKTDGSTTASKRGRESGTERAASSPAVIALKALAHPLRLQILELLSHGEQNVGQVEQLTGIGQPALSQQLAVLRKANLVITRKEAKQVFYEPNARALGELSRAINALAGDPARPADHNLAQRTTQRKNPAGAASFARIS